MSKLLINEPPLQVLPSLAVAIGLNEAIFLQQLHYWLRISNHVHDDRVWVYNTYDGWLEQFPFWSVPTIRRVVTSLRNLSLIITTDKYNKLGFDNTLWYTVDYDALSALSVTPSDQSDHTVGSERSEDARELIRPIPETNTDTSAKTQKRPRQAQKKSYIPDYDNL